MLLFGVTAYGILVLVSWLHEEDMRKRTVAIVSTLGIIAAGSLFFFVFHLTIVFVIIDMRTVSGSLFGIFCRNSTIETFFS